MNTPSTYPCRPSPFIAQPQSAFTLLEALVACSILMVILAMLLTMVNQTTKIWASTNTSVQEFQRARQAFDIVNNRLSQATLNTYWDYRRINDVPTEYIRQSDLRFICKPAASLLNSNDSTRNPGQAVFFQAPGGVNVSNTVSATPGSLCTWGYFVDYGSDQDYRPEFFGGVIPERYRFRLFEMMEPTNQLTIYNYTSGSSSYTGTEWFTTPLAHKTYRRIIADNVIALVLLPKLSIEDDTTGAKLAPDYTYDTTGTNSSPTLNPKNQLPPLVEMVIVVIDEHSAAKLRWTATPPDFGLDKLFLNASREQRLSDLNTLEENLHKASLVSRRFSVTVPLRSAKWSTSQTN